MSVQLSIIVVSYNTREMTLACLRSVYQQTAGTSFELIVVDNASSDGSAEAISAEFPDAQLIASGVNLGFAGGNNRAAEHASGEHLLLLNPDTVVLNGAIDELMAFARRRPEAKIWGGRTVFEDGSLNPSSCWGRQTLWSVTSNALGLNVAIKSVLFDPEALGGWDRSTERNVDIVSGCFFLITRDLWHELGGFHPDFFMYGEEADLCLRAGKLGAKPAVTPEATIIHHGGASETVRGEKIAKVFLAKAKLLRRHWPRWAVWYGSLMLRARVLLRAALYELSARLRGHAGHRAQAGAWWTVWRLREQWAGGTAHAIVTAPRGAPSSQPPASATEGGT